MTTRTPLLSVLLLFVLASTRAPAADAAPAAVPAATPAASAAAATATATATPATVVIKDDDPHAKVATKGKDAAGRDTLSVDFPDEDVRNILRNVADLFELNLVIPETLQGKASIKLRDVSWRQIFQVVLDPLNYSYIEDGNIIKIVSNDSLTKEPVSTEVFLINYARAADLLPTVKSLISSPGSRIDLDTRTNSLVITEAPSRMNRIRPIIEQLDRATDQVMIESKFVEVTDGDVHNIGVNWASLNGYKVGVGPDPAANGVVGGYSNSQTHLTSNGSNGSNGTTNGTTNGTNGGTTNGTTGNQTSGSTSSTGITTTNGTPTTTISSSVNTGLTNTTLTSTTAGTTANTTSTASDTLNLLHSLTNGVSAEKTLSAVFTADQFGLIISALTTLTKSKVVSNPTIVTLNNTEAFINIGKEYPIPRYTYNEQRGSFEVAGFDYKPIGIILKVTPQVNARGFIKLTIEPEVSSFNDADSVNFGGAGSARIPVIQTKKARTQISLRDGYTMGIGGLIDTTSANTDTKVPVLGSIPILGRLFSSKSRTTQSQNLLIFLTAKTLPAEGAPPGVIFDPRQIRDMGLKADEMPGYRDGSDPFAPAVNPKAKKAKKSDSN